MVHSTGFEPVACPLGERPPGIYGRSRKRTGVLIYAAQVGIFDPAKPRLMRS